MTLDEVTPIAGNIPLHTRHVSVRLEVFDGLDATNRRAAWTVREWQR
jgi:hypothetical protein